MTSTTPPASELRSKPSSHVHEDHPGSEQAAFIVRLARADRASFEEITPAEVSIAAGVCAPEALKMGVPAPFRALLIVVCS